MAILLVVVAVLYSKCVGIGSGGESSSCGSNTADWPSPTITTGITRTEEK